MTHLNVILGINGHWGRYSLGHIARLLTISSIRDSNSVFLDAYKRS